MLCERKSVLTLVPGWRLERTRGDSMHIVNLGVAWIVVGNALWFLTANNASSVLASTGQLRLPANATRADILHDMYLKFKKWCKDRSLTCSCRRFTLAAIQRDKMDKLVFFRSKAAQSPMVVAWLSEACGEFAKLCPDGIKTEAEVVSSCLWGLSKYVRIIRTSDRSKGHQTIRYPYNMLPYRLPPSWSFLFRFQSLCMGTASLESPRFLTQEQVKALDEAGHTFLYMFSELNRMTTDPHLWHHIPKLHQLHHIILDVIDDQNNPRFFHCFGDEDMVGIMLKLAKSCHASTVVRNCVDKYTVGLLSRLAEFFDR